MEERRGRSLVGRSCSLSPSAPPLASAPSPLPLPPLQPSTSSDQHRDPCRSRRVTSSVWGSEWKEGRVEVNLLPPPSSISSRLSFPLSLPFFPLVYVSSLYILLLSNSPPVPLFPSFPLCVLCRFSLSSLPSLHHLPTPRSSLSTTHRVEASSPNTQSVIRDDIGGSSWLRCCLFLSTSLSQKGTETVSPSGSGRFVLLRPLSLLLLPLFLPFSSISFRCLLLS